MTLLLLKLTAFALVGASNVYAADERSAVLRGSASNGESLGSECTDLGETAAEMIVFRNVCSPQFASPNSGMHFSKNCREVAYGICKGQVSSVSKEYCPDDKLSTSELLNLQNMCKDQVDGMIGKDSDRERPPGSSKSSKSSSDMEFNRVGSSKSSKSSADMTFNRVGSSKSSKSSADTEFNRVGSSKSSKSSADLEAFIVSAVA